jgi:hypothetical protein
MFLSLVCISFFVAFLQSYFLISKCIHILRLRTYIYTSSPDEVSLATDSADGGCVWSGGCAWSAEAAETDGEETG